MCLVLLELPDFEDKPFNVVKNGSEKRLYILELTNIERKRKVFNFLIIFVIFLFLIEIP